MQSSDNFYIGWKDEMPNDKRVFLRKRLWLAFALLIFIALAFVFSQKAFNKHQFEFGNVRTLKGIYYQEPVPIFQASPGQLPETVNSCLLLVGYGKFGALNTMDAIQLQTGSLHGKEITLSGTLIHGDQHSIFELTEQQESLKAVSNNDVTSAIAAVKTDKTVELQGEILDPKCYFGVMKPGEGKIHKSCAIRCISGGIPPVLRVTQPDESYRYYVMLGASGEMINQDVLSYVAEAVSVQAEARQFLEWDILYVNDIAQK